MAHSTSRRTIALVAAFSVAIGSAAITSSCANDDATTDGSSTPSSSASIGQPDPPLPLDVNAIPFTVGSVAGLGNSEISISLPDAEATEGLGDDVFAVEVTVTSGSLESFTLRPDMFRVYTVDGRSYTPEAIGEIAQFGTVTIESGESHTGLLAVRIATDSPPALLLADLSDLGERFLPGAFTLDPTFVPVSPEE